MSNTIYKIPMLILLSMTIGLTGCQTFKKSNGKAEKAKYSEMNYYQNALDDINKGHYTKAGGALKELRTFYPAGAHAQQALLDLMYVQYQQHDFEEVIDSAKKFINLYPNDPKVDYAFYVLGVANMSEASKGNLIPLDQSARDIAYYRLAFGAFAELIGKYPNSVYAPDSAQRMTFIYNQLASHEIHVARWYVKRKAYVASARRAKWVFQHYPKSESIPEAIATLAYSYQQLGNNELANKYKQLLQINYPNWLTATGEVKLIDKKKSTSSVLNKLTLGKFGRSSDTSFIETQLNQYEGQTRTQIIHKANRLLLPRK